MANDFKSFLAFRMGSAVANSSGPAATGPMLPAYIAAPDLFVPEMLEAPIYLTGHPDPDTSAAAPEAPAADEVTGSTSDTPAPSATTASAVEAAGGESVDTC